MAKSSNRVPSKPTQIIDKPIQIAAKPAVEPSELVVKEIMIQKNCTRDEAIHILKNPAPHK